MVEEGHPFDSTASLLGDAARVGRPVRPRGHDDDPVGVPDRLTTRGGDDRPPYDGG